eukprot:TRINITY_DN9623_c0_g1_i1.p1 TRINITY_DN9623_c0_g1~~TRINITY_DN9623_c0_g1_i1.p1  ORF type:complete len:433 (-),score=73.15 TRINITY_DN9623_c0_g1_i1:15-1313(-)
MTKLKIFNEPNNYSTSKTRVGIKINPCKCTRQNCSIELICESLGDFALGQLIGNVRTSIVHVAKMLGIEAEVHFDQCDKLMIVVECPVSVPMIVKFLGEQKVSVSGFAEFDGVFDGVIDDVDRSVPTVIELDHDFDVNDSVGVGNKYRELFSEDAEVLLGDVFDGLLINNFAKMKLFIQGFLVHVSTVDTAGKIKLLETIYKEVLQLVHQVSSISITYANNYQVSLNFTNLDLKQYLDPYDQIIALNQCPKEFELYYTIATRNIIPFKILMLGLDLSGKTDYLYTRLKRNGENYHFPTIGFNVETVIDEKGMNYTIWDVGGSEKIRSLWKHYYENSHCIFWVIDAIDKQRLKDSHREMTKVINETKCEYLLVILNKIDLDDPLTIDDVTLKLELDQLLINWHIIESGHGEFDTYHESIQWFRNQMFKGWNEM